MRNREWQVRSRLVLHSIIGNIQWEMSNGEWEMDEKEIEIEIVEWWKMSSRHLEIDSVLRIFFMHS